jgi:hypothetical protein
MAEIESFFDDRIILKALWLPRAPDLSTPDFFLCGALRGKAYANKPHTIQKLEKSKRIPSIFKDESTGSCICLWKLAVAVATYVSFCIV